MQSEQISFNSWLIFIVIGLLAQSKILVKNDYMLNKKSTANMKIEKKLYLSAL